MLAGAWRKAHTDTEAQAPLSKNAVEISIASVIRIMMTQGKGVANL